MVLPSDVEAGIDYDPGERRFSYRCRTNQPAAIKIGKRKLLATIADESAGGFGVLVSGLARCEIGEVVLLKVKYISGWVRARVVNITVLHAGPNIHTRLGLTRLGERDRSAAWLHFLPFKPFISYSYTTGISIALGAAAIVCGLIWLAERTLPMFTHARLEIAGTPTPGIPTYRPFNSRRLSGPNSRHVTKPQDASPQETLLPNAVHRLRPEALLRAEVVKMLGLNPDQQERLRRIATDRDRLESTDLTDEVEQRFALATLHVLNEKQRSQWLSIERSGQQ